MHRRARIWPLLRILRNQSELAGLTVSISISGVTRAVEREESQYFAQLQSRPDDLWGPTFLNGNHDVLRPTDLPHLRSISAMSSELLALVPGRPVTSLTLLHGVDLTQGQRLWKAVSTSTGPLTHITLRWYHWFSLSINIQAISQHLPQLQSLSLEQLWSHTSYAAEVSASLKPLQRLPKLRIELFYPNGRVPAWTPEAWTNLHLKCPNVEEIVIVRRSNLEGSAVLQQPQYKLAAKYWGTART
ncbi:hypothetical protein FRB95_001737 [Tulasnella sp. JGI-2019a]|nr:hypothetical protein FRB95_001737 [Tulasnella sp. JGI-2019a]